MELRDGTRVATSSPPPRYSTTEDQADEAQSESDDWTIAEGFSISRGRHHDSQADLLIRLCVFIGVSWTIGLYLAYPAPTTIPLFIGSAFVLAAWAVLSWLRLLKDLIQRKDSLSAIKARYPLRSRMSLGFATGLLLWWTAITYSAGAEATPVIQNGERYFIAVNLHNNEAILHDFIREMTMLIFHRKSSKVC
jgi:hypothetical protein